MAETKLSQKHKLKTFLSYFFMLGIAAAIFLTIRNFGEQLASPGGTERVVGGLAHNQMNTLLHVLLALCVIIVTARAIGALFKYVSQPAVIGEVIGGIILGPSLLGHIAPDVSAFLLPQAAFPILGVIAQLGVILYMFLVGLELDLRILKKSGHSTLAISHASIVLPFLLGTGLALAIYSDVSSPDVSFTSFALFLGVSLSVTAFPVLARILTDQEMQKTQMGMIALTCAAVDDATAWCLLAFVVSISQANLSGALQTLSLTLLFVILMLFLIRPIAIRAVSFVESRGQISEGVLAIILVAILLSAVATEFIGIHAIFGAFLLGAIIPHSSRVASELRLKLEDLVRIMFLPAFFAFTGMRTQFGLLDRWEDWSLCLVIIGLATFGKMGGTYLASRLTGLKWRDALSLGVLMNTRGLVELIVLNIGLDLKIITPRLFAMLVVMALVTTFMTTPLLRLLMPDSRLNPAGAAVRRAST